MDDYASWVSNDEFKEIKINMAKKNYFPESHTEIKQ